MIQNRINMNVSYFRSWFLIQFTLWLWNLPPIALSMIASGPMVKIPLALPGEKCVSEDVIDGVPRFIIRRNDGSAALYVAWWSIRSNVQFLQAQLRDCTCSMLHIFWLLLMSAPSLLFDKLPSQPGHRISEIVRLPASLCRDRFRETNLSMPLSPYPVSSFHAVTYSKQKCHYFSKLVLLLCWRPMYAIMSTMSKLTKLGDISS